MYYGNEYKILNISNKINIEPVIGEDKFPMPLVGETIKIENKNFKVIYINKGKRRISLVPLS